MMMEHEFLKKFATITSKGLPGERAHAILMPTNRPSSRAAINNEVNYRDSAVGVILHPVDNIIRCILIQRPDYIGFHGNQVSFPGGKMDENDPNLEYTARRECFEEVDLPIGIGRHIGELSPVYIPVSEFLVHPFILFVDELPLLSPDPREVESIISFDISELRNEENIKRADIILGNGLTRKDVPYFDIEGKKVWGATAMMLAELKAILDQF